jgi:hypothetical protein
MAIYLDTTLCAIQGVPCIIALAKGKDPTTRTVCGILLALDVAFGIGPNVGLELNRTMFQIVCATLGALGVFAAVRVAQPVLSTLIVTGGGILAVIGLGLVTNRMVN